MEIYEKYDVGVLWRLFQYVSPTGRRTIDDWRAALTVAGRADFDVFLRNMAKKSKWQYPDIGGLSDKHLKGFRELRWKSSNVPHRVGGYFSSDAEFVMLIGWTHNAKKYTPPTALDLLVKRSNHLSTGEASICEYSIFTGSAVKK